MEKIVIFTPTLNIGGIERVLLTYAKGLGLRGYDVIYLTSTNKADFEPESLENVKFVNLNAPRLRKSLFSLIKFFRNINPNIILTANDATLIVFFAKIISGSSAKIVTSQHNYYQNNEEVGLRQKFIIKYIYPLCYKVIAVSDGIQKMLTCNFRMDFEKVKTIYNPIDLKMILASAEEPIEEILKDDYILFVGRLSIVKNLPFLLKSFSLFKESYSTVKLLIIGDGEDYERIVGIIEELNLKNFVYLMGSKPNPFPYIKNAKIIALSSKTEALPTILLESLALGKTIVSTPTQGALDILKNGELGYISKNFSDENDFCNVLKQAYNNPFDEKNLFSAVDQSYNLESKIVEFENLLK